MKERVIFHIDVNNAFLSWTAVYLLKNGFNKDIRKVPSIIGGDEHSRRGIVLAKSPVAKKYGIVTAEPIYQARKKCPILEIYPSNYSWYQEKSNELMSYLKNYSPDQEQLSVDECFLDMTGMKYIYDDLIELAYKIKDEIKTKFGYTVNIGIANNKLCAKMASDFEKPDKVHTLFNNEIKEKMWPLPVNDLYMCGKKTAEQLNKLNIKTIGDLANTNSKILEKYFKSYGKYLKEAANGIDNSKVEKRKSKNKSISTTTTLPHNYKDIDSLKMIVLNQVEEITRELRDKKLYAKTVGVIFKNKDFISYSAQETFDKPTDNTKEILNKTYKVLEENYKEDEIRLIGVRLSNLTQEKQEQISLFEENKEEGEDILQKTMDKINNKFGKSLINPASFNNISKKKEQK
ncbi:MAG: DNA polymerase IV [Bacilli bacterium]|nr:DNA polymerase IV [Bacilli bacterium]